jgi:hypothetical protein
MRWLWLLVIACRANGNEPAPRPQPAMRVVQLDTQRGATELYGGADLVLGFVRTDADKPGPLRLSRGLGPVARELTGWPLGVAKDSAYIVRPEDDVEVVIERVGLTGDPLLVARAPGPKPYAHPEGAVTGDGHVAIWMHPTLRVVGPDGTTRDLDLSDHGGVRALVGNPNGSELALAMSHENSTELLLVDTAAGTVRWVKPTAQRSGSDGEVGFAGAMVVQHAAGAITGYSIASGEAKPVAKIGYITQRNMAFAPSGHAVAYSHYVHPSDMMPLASRHGCDIYAARGDRDPNAEAIASYNTECYYGAGLLFVDDVLWIAPP